MRRTGRDPERQDVAELIRMRMSLLSGPDRALMTLYLDGGKSFRRIAALVGLSPTTVSRRIRRITARLIDETYRICLKGAGFSRADLAVVKDHFVRGFTVSRISDRRQMSYYRVRSTVQRAQRYARAAQSLRSATER